MAFDGATQHTIMFGGLGDGLTTQTWAFDGTTWRSVSTVHVPATGPGGAFRGMMTADPAMPSLVLEGWDGGQVGNTYQFTGTDWTVPRPAACPAPSGCRAQAAFAFDPASAKLILASGGSQGLTNETDSWDGHSWTPVRTGTMPPAMDFTAATDAAGGNIVATTCAGDTWLYRGGDWVIVHPQHPLPAMSKFGMCSIAYDSDHKVVIVTGVADSDPSVLTVWAWDGQDWAPVPAR